MTVPAGATYALNKDADVNVSWAMVWFRDLVLDKAKPFRAIELPVSSKAPGFKP